MKVNLSLIKSALQSKTVLAIIALVALNETAVADLVLSAIQVPEAYSEPVQAIVNALVAIVGIYGRLNPVRVFTSKKK